MKAKFNNAYANYAESVFSNPTVPLPALSDGA